MSFAIGTCFLVMGLTTSRHALFNIVIKIYTYHWPCSRGDRLSNGSTAGGGHKMSPLTFLFLVYDRRFQPSPQESELPPPTCGYIFIQSYEANKSTLSSSISLSAVILLRSCKFKSLFFFFSALTLDAAKTKRTNFPLQCSSSLPPPSRFYVIALIVGCHEGRATGILEVVCPPLRWRASKANLGDAHCRPVSSFITGL